MFFLTFFFPTCQNQVVLSPSLETLHQSVFTHYSVACQAWRSMHSLHIHLVPGALRCHNNHGEMLHLRTMKQLLHHRQGLEHILESDSVYNPPPGRPRSEPQWTPGSPLARLSQLE